MTDELSFKKRRISMVYEDEDLERKYQNMFCKDTVGYLKQFFYSAMGVNVLVYILNLIKHLK